MTARLPAHAADLRQGILEAFVVNERLNQLLLEYIDPRAWRQQLPGDMVKKRTRGRTIAGIFAHVHNVRCKWLRLSAPHLKTPRKLDHARCVQKQTKQALAKSGALCSQMLADALAPGGRIAKFHRDGWARAWTPGMAMFAYMMAHEAHHRGQVCMLAHQLGFPLPNKATYEMWNWEKLWKRCGFSAP
jgi:uncharacterized damage-inducible protein DinB